MLPLSHRKLSSWYDQLALQLEAGLPFAAAIRSSRGTGLPASGLDVIAREIETGGTIEAAWKNAEPWLPLSDRLVLTAAADVGRMPQLLKRLSLRHAQLGAAKRRLLTACAYPLVLLHVGLIVLPLTQMIDWDRGFTWDPIGYVRRLALTLLPLWLILIVFGTLIRRQNSAVARAARMLPFVGAYLRSQALADLAFSLGSFIEAGMRIDRAWSLSGSVSNRPELKRAAAALHAAAARGERPGLQLAAWSCFPPDFVALYQTGETTGQLDHTLLRLAAQHQDHAQRALTLTAVVYPGLMLFIVAAAVIYNVVKFYAGYLKMIEKLAT